jgi:hypothetical protein
MTLRFLAVLLTLVVLKTSIVEAKPHSDAPKDSVVVDDEEVVSQETIDALSITPPKPDSFREYSQQFSRSDYFHNYRKAITLRAGAVFGFEDSSDDEDLTNALFGFSFLVPRKRSPQLEVGADLSTVGHGHFTFMSRHIFNERSSFRPYYRYGVMHKLDPDDKFASFSDWENYLGRFGFGFENSTRRSRSWRIEVELAAGGKDILGFLTLGHVYSW